MGKRVLNLAKLLANQDGWAFEHWHMIDRKGQKVYVEYAEEILEHLGIPKGIDTSV